MSLFRRLRRWLFPPPILSMGEARARVDMLRAMRRMREQQ